MAKNIELRMSDGNSYNKNGFNIKTSWENIDGKPTNFVPTSHPHDAEDITSGTFASARIPTLPVSKIDGLSTQLTNTNNELNNKIEFGDIPLPILSIDKPISELNNNTLRDIFETKYPQINSYKVNEELYNYIDYDNLVFHENVGQFVLTGSDIAGLNGFKYDDTYIYVISYTFVDLDLTDLLERGEFKNNLFNNTYGTIEPNKDSMTMWTTRFRFMINVGLLNEPTLNGVRQYFNQNPLTVTYELAEKQELPLTEQDLEDLPKTNEELDYYFKLYEKYKNDPLFDEEGKIEEGLIPYLSASKINSGVFHEEAIPNLPISKIEDLDNTLSAMATAIAGKSEKGHEHSQYLTDAPKTGSEYVRKSGEWVVSSAGSENDSRISDTNILNWNAAYGWGNHASAGYLKSAPNTYITSGNYSTPPAGKRWVGTSAVSDPYYNIGTDLPTPDSSVLPDPSGLPAGRTGYVYTQSLPMQEAYYIVQEIEVDHGLITLTRNSGGKVEFTIPKPDGGGGGDLSGYVPTSRTIAGKNLESDITVASLQSALNVPTSISDLLAQTPSDQDMLAYSSDAGWLSVTRVPDATRWDGYRIRSGSGLTGQSGYITFSY